MLLTEARALLRNSVTDSTDASLDRSEDVDFAVYTAGEHFCRATRCLRQASNVSLVADNSAADISAMVTLGFRPEMLLKVFLSGIADPLTVVDYSALNGAQAEDPTTGTPKSLAFLDWTTAAVWPTPSIPYTMVIQWWKPFTTWTFGTATPDSITLNLPVDYLTRVISEGAASVLSAANKKDPFSSVQGARFLQYVERMAGAGSLGTRAVYRNRLS